MSLETILSAVGVTILLIQLFHEMSTREQHKSLCILFPKRLNGTERCCTFHVLFLRTGSSLPSIQIPFNWLLLCPSCSLGPT